MDKRYRRWARSLLAAVLALLALCAAIVYAVDPCLYYRMPERWKPVFFNERYQAAGMLKHLPGDTVLLGSSMVANIRASWAAEALEDSVVRITIPDGYFCEFDQAMDLLFRTRTPERVVFALDLNILIRDDSGVTGAMPDYLYNQNPFDDLKYLLNKDTLYYSLYVLLQNRWGGGQPVDDAFLWDDGTVWESYEALRTYVRPETFSDPIPANAYEEETAGNLAVMEAWFQNHPDTRFDVYFSPYSMLFWDRTLRRGEVDARLSAMAQVCQALTEWENVRLYAPIFDKEIVTDLENYCDYVHHSGESGKTVLEKLQAGQFLLTGENWRQELEAWREFVVNYDYNSLWTPEFWERWIPLHDYMPVWWESDVPSE